MKKENKKEDAVSPVIGVMLMLVVTVVIAAVVVMFSTGLAGSTETTPTALFEVSYVGTYDTGGRGGELTNIGLRHKGGDVIALKDLQITLETKGGINSGLVFTHQASDAKTKKDMSEGEYIAASDSDKSEFNRLKGEYQEAIEAINNYKQQYGITEDTFLEWQPYWDGSDPDDPKWEALKNTYGMSWSDMESLSEKAQTYNNRLDQFNTNRWDINADAPPDTISGGDSYAISVLGQVKPTESIVSTGDIIHVVQFDGTLNTRIFDGNSVKWTISYIPTNSIIAKGEFEVIAD